MIRPARNDHPQRNQLTRLAVLHQHKQRFGGSEADASATSAPPWPYEPEGPPEDINWTTRRFPRTLSGVDSAWPTSATYADPFERWETAQIEQHEQAVALHWKWGVRAVFIIFAGVALALYMGWIG